MTVTIKVEGLNEIKDAIEQLPKAIGKDVMRNVLMARATPIAETAKALAPVRHGELRDSIVASTRLSSGQKQDAKETASYVEVYAGAGPLPYAHLVEFGSIHNPTPEPFMRRAWDGAKGSMLDGLKNDLWAEIEKAVTTIARKAVKG